jgi:predicted enzyme related to lactoylglutathione lyase
MSSPQSYPSGTPVWVNLQTVAGPQVASRFYCALFGWTVLARHRPMEDTSGWWVFRLDGKDVGDVGPGPRPTWTMNISVDDADVTARAVVDNGGGISLWPTPYFGSGRMAICTDPLGARFAIWESSGQLSPDVMHEPGSYTWCELTCRDVDEARRFYATVFGWESSFPPFLEGSGYSVFALPGAERPVAGMVEVDEAWTEHVQPHWTIYFAVADADGIAARAVELGGSVEVEPFDLFNVGRIAGLKDPEGASFSVVQRSDQ